MNSVASSELLEIINFYSRTFACPAGLQPAGLLYAIAAVESGVGMNCTPRHEVEYCHLRQWHRKSDGSLEWRTGLYAERMQALTHVFGCWAHCSYGWAQIMYSNVKGAFTPFELDSNPEKVAQALVSFLKADVLPHVSTIEDFCRVYNGPKVSNQYIDEFKKYYATPIPGLQKGVTTA